MRIISKLALVTLGASALSCSADGYLQQERTEQQEEAIYYGDLDTTHPAVVTVFAGGGVCTGTIIQVSGSTAYILTAAHCLVGNGTTPLPVSQVDVALGSNYNNPTAYLNVVQTRVHPLYDGTDGSANDFGMIRATGASASTPFIPAMTPAQDNLAVGTQLNLIGFGQTESSYSNSTRRYIIKPIVELYGGWIWFDQSGTSGGTCQGDSGGPAVTVGTERVAGVTSFGEQGCIGYGADGRVSMVYDSFILPFINGTTGTISCNECNNAVSAGGGACVSSIDACFNNSSCNAFVSCINGCSDDACWNQCIQSNPTGADLYSAIYDCICNTCDTECATDPMCAAPTCGFAFAEASCDSCSDSACCSQEQACADDATCPSCLSANPPAACSTNAAMNAYFDCLGTNCETECGVSSANCGFTSSDTNCQSCIEGQCCAEGKACGDDATCTACIVNDPTPAGCDTNTLANGFLDCLSNKCATECGAGGTGGTGGTGGFAGTGGTAGTGGGTAGTGGGTAGTGGDAGMGGAAGSAGTGATAGSAGSAGGTAGNPGTTPSKDSSGDSGGCATSAGSKNAGAAGALLLFGAALAFLRRRR